MFIRTLYAAVVLCALGFAHAADQPAESKESAIPIPDPPPRWEIKSGQHISTALQEWSRRTGKWHLAWEAPDLVSQIDVELEGSFESAVSQVIVALNRSDAGLYARFYVNSAAPVLRITEKK